MDTPLIITSWNDPTINPFPLTADQQALADELIENYEFAMEQEWTTYPAMGRPFPTYEVTIEDGEFIVAMWPQHNLFYRRTLIGITPAKLSNGCYSFSASHEGHKAIRRHSEKAHDMILISFAAWTAAGCPESMIYLHE